MAHVCSLYRLFHLSFCVFYSFAKGVHEQFTVLLADLFSVDISLLRFLVQEFVQVFLMFLD